MSRIIRKNERAVISGVCQGVGEHIDIAPFILRILWCVSIMCYGVGILLYIILWIILPVDYSD